MDKIRPAFSPTYVEEHIFPRRAGITTLHFNLRAGW